MNEITVGQDKTTVAIGPGNRWLEVYLKLDALAIATSGGRVGIVGVGGLILGGTRQILFMPVIANSHPGGISFFSPRYGFDCDNVLNFEVSPMFHDFERLSSLISWV